MAGLFDALFSGIGDAIADIRQRVVEEGWFGRIVTGDPVEVTRRSDYRDIQPEGRSFEEMWEADPEHLPEALDHLRGMDELWMPSDPGSTGPNGDIPRQDLGIDR